MASLSQAQRDKMPASDFAVPGKRALPIHDATHTRLAWQMVDRTEGLTSSEKATARARILRRAKSQGINTDDWKASAESELQAIELTSLELQAMSLMLPEITGGHPNRMPFSGVLTRVGVASDKAPNGANGRRVLITAEAAERALPSLLGMGVNLTSDASGHAPSAKIGIITSAHVVDSELRIEGFVYASDHPDAALRIKLMQGELGFSFEASNIGATDIEADPVVINELVFTGAAILLKNKAAYTTTRLAALAAMAQEEIEQMDPEGLKATLTEVVNGALAPVTAQVGRLETAHTAMAVQLTELSAAMEAQRALSAKVEPLATGLDKQAQQMEAAGIGDGQMLRRMAEQMRLDAAAGRLPQTFMPVASPTALTPAVIQAPPPPPVPATPRVEDSEGYRTLQASIAQLTEELAKARDEQAAAATKFADLKAQQQQLQPAPNRKTLDPAINHLLAKGGISMPDDGKFSVAKLDSVLAGSKLTSDERMRLKTVLAGAEMVPFGIPVSS